MVLFLILIQLVAIPVFAEIMVLGMPQTLKRASEQNHYRMDGTKSRNRKRREVRAIGRLRRDLLAVLIVVCLIADALCLAMESQVTSFQTLGELIWSQVDKDSPDRQVPELRKARLASAQQGRRVTGEQLDRYWPWLNVVLAGGAFGGLLMIGCGTFMAYGAFAAGVKSRALEHAKLDLDRMRNREWDTAAQDHTPSATVR